jgi:hypothetical protein
MEDYWATIFSDLDVELDEGDGGVRGGAAERTCNCARKNKLSELAKVSCDREVHN